LARVQTVLEFDLKSGPLRRHDLPSDSKAKWQDLCPALNATNGIAFRTGHKREYEYSTYKTAEFISGYSRFPSPFPASDFIFTYMYLTGAAWLILNSAVRNIVQSSFSQSAEKTHVFEIDLIFKVLADWRCPCSGANLPSHEEGPR
jgi:hypothetical protein